MIEWQPKTIAQILRAAHKNLFEIKYRSHFGHATHNWPLIELYSKQLRKNLETVKNFQDWSFSFAPKKREEKFLGNFFTRKKYRNNKRGMVAFWGQNHSQQLWSFYRIGNLWQRDELASNVFHCCNFFYLTKNFFHPKNSEKVFNKSDAHRAESFCVA